jgi:hypothetical protein
LHLTLVLPDGSRSLIPASWTDLDPNPPPDFTPSTERIGTIPHLIHACKVVDALLRKLDDAGKQNPIPSKEESKRAETISPVAPRKSPATRHLAGPQPRQQKSIHRCLGQSNRKGSLSPKRKSNQGGQP